MAEPVAPYATTTDLYLLDENSNQVIKVTPGGIASVVITEAEIIAATGESSANFNDNAIAFNAMGTMYFTEQVSDSILKYEGGVLTVLTTGAAIAAVTGSADPEGITVGSDGFLYVSEDNTENVLKINPTTGAVSIFTSHASLDALGGITSTDLESSIVAAPGGVIYVGSEGSPNAVFKIDSTGTPTVLASGAPFKDFDVFMTRAPNGDIIIADDSLANTIYRITPGGVVSVFLSEAAIDAVNGGSSVDLEGGIAFDSSGNFYIAEENSDNLLKFTPGLVGSIFVSSASFSAQLGFDVDWESGIAFAPGLSSAAEPSGLLLAVAGLAVLGFRRRRRKTTT